MKEGQDVNIMDQMNELAAEGKLEGCTEYVIGGVLPDSMLVLVHSSAASTAKLISQLVEQLPAELQYIVGILAKQQAITNFDGTEQELRVAAMIGLMKHVLKTGKDDGKKSKKAVVMPELSGEWDEEGTKDE